MHTSFISVPIATPLFLELAAFLKAEEFPHDPTKIIEDAIHYWMENVSWKKEDMYPEVHSSEKGYKWKNVFLPHGTRVRMKYKGDMHYGTVIGDQLFYNEQPISPSEFAKKIGGGVSRNAWLALEIKRPSNSGWMTADKLRTLAEELINDIENSMASFGSNQGGGK